MEQRKKSTDSDRRGLLEFSRPASILTTTTTTTTQQTNDDRTPTQSTENLLLGSSALPVSDSTSKPRSQSTPEAAAVTVRPYRGFSSEEAYLAALRSWASEKETFDSDFRLIGFYGRKTTEDYLNAPGGPWSKSKAERQAAKERKKAGKLERERQRRQSLPNVFEADSVSQGDVDGDDDGDGDDGEVRKDGRRPSIAKNFGRAFARRKNARLKDV